jgi:hypothetical protein
VYLDEDSPYRPLLDKLGPFRSAPVSVEEVADVVAATIDGGRHGTIPDSRGPDRHDRVGGAQDGAR